MTTKITSLYNAFVSLIEAASTSVTMTRIPNPYLLDKAPGGLLTNGYGLQIGPATNPRQDITPQLRMEREIQLVMTRLITTTDNNASARGALEKTLFEDAWIVLKAVEADSTLGGVIADLAFIGDSGIEILETENALGSYFVLTSTYQVRYIESLT